MIPPLTYDQLVRLFAEADEQFPEDLSAICVDLVRDVHYDALELTVAVHGRDGVDADCPIISDVVPDVDELLDLDGIRAGQPVLAASVSALFDERTKHLLAAMDMAIAWNRSDATGTWIRQNGVLPTRPLLPMDQ